MTKGEQKRQRLISLLIIAGYTRLPDGRKLHEGSLADLEYMHIGHLIEVGKELTRIESEA